MTDHQHLRELAQNATPGPWGWDTTPTEDGKGTELWNVVGPDSWDVAHTAACGLPEQDEREAKARANMQFIAAANPEAILALLTELEDARAAYQLTRHQLDAHRAGQGTYEGTER